MSPFVRNRTGWASFFCAAVLAAAVAVATRAALAAVDWVVAPGAQAIAASDKDESKRPFRLIVQSTENTESLQDFDRHRQRGTWERAFKALTKARNANPNALVPRDDDFYIPSRLYVRQLLADLPQAGKDAYRLFNDPEAKKLLEQARGPEEIAQLTKLVEDYFLSSISDRAADRLGELEFERGDVEQAADRWLSVLRYRPDTDLKPADLLLKSGIALARAGRWDECRGLLKQLRERYADQQVRLAGREVNALAHLSGLVEAQASKATQAGNSVNADLRFAPEVKLLWQFQTVTPATAKQLAEANNNWMWNGSPVTNDLVPPTVCDDKRVYVNFLGFAFALDLQSGKLAWRSEKFHDAVQKVRQNRRLLAEQHGICLGGERLFLVAHDVTKLNEQNLPFLLSCREAATGKELWTTEKVEALKKWHIWGAPIAAADRVYVTAFEQNKNRDLHLLALQANDGKLLWSTHLGTYQTDEMNLWNQRSSRPDLLLQGERLYVDTQIGTVILLDTRNGSILWGFNYDSDAPESDFWWGEPRKLFTSGPPVIVEDVLFVKGMRSARLCAVQLTGPTVLFKRPVSGHSVVIGADEERIYLGGDELAALDRQAKKLLWATRVPIASDFTRPIMTANRLYQFTPRGIFEIDKSTGDVVKRYRGVDLDSLGGALQLAGNTLLSVSNLSITAYPLSDDPAATEKVASEEPAAAVPHTKSLSLITDRSSAPVNTREAAR